MKRNNKFSAKCKASTKYLIKCFDKNGKLKWEEKFNNTVVTAGLNKLLDATFVTGSVVPLWYVGLKNSAAGILAADTMSSHAGWVEGTLYSNTTRPQFISGTIAAGVLNNSASTAVFTINDTGIIYGAFLVNDNTKGGTSGTLYGVGDFAAPRAVISGDIVEVTIIIAQTSA